MLCSIRPENVLAQVQQMGHDRFTLTTVAEWMAGDAPAQARTVHDVEKILQVEKDVARAFLAAQGLEARQEPTDKLTVADIHCAVEQRSGKKIPISQIQEWVSGPGKMYTTQYFQASALPRIAHSAAAHYLRSVKK
jgi:hypothetical protein